MKLREIAATKRSFKDSGPSPEIPDSIRQKDYWHGVNDEETGKKILAAGRLEPATYGHNRQGGAGFQKSRDDKVYLANGGAHFATIHTLGGVVHGTDMKGHGNSRYGYLFKVSGRDLNHVEADEDTIGDIYGETHDEHHPPGWHTAHNLREPERHPAFKGYHLRHVLSPREHMYAVGGEALWRSHAGKKLAKEMSPELHHELIANHGAHIAHGGPVKITGAWRFDRSRTREIGRDGKSFFDIAEPVHHLIGKQESIADTLIRQKLRESDDRHATHRAYPLYATAYGSMDSSAALTHIVPINAEGFPSGGPLCKRAKAEHVMDDTTQAQPAHTATCRGCLKRFGINAPKAEKPKAPEGSVPLSKIGIGHRFRIPGSDAVHLRMDRGMAMSGGKMVSLHGIKHVFPHKREEE